jgi:hypothetical protein
MEHYQRQAVSGRAKKGLHKDKSRTQAGKMRNIIKAGRWILKLRLAKLLGNLLTVAANSLDCPALPK